LCRKDLILSVDFLVCPCCHHTYQVQYGIPIFSNNVKYFGEIDKKELDLINEQLDTRPFDELVPCLKRNTRELLEYLLGPQRAKGLDILNIRPGDHVLDFGAGYGGLSIAMAEKGAQVDSVEWVLEKLVLLKSIARQRGLRTINCVKADCKTLPFRAGTFTKIIMNGFLEWVPLEFLNMKPRSAQIRVLQTCFNLLKDNGELFIAIENRCWFPYFIGHHDPHERRLRFVTILPRCIANIFSYCWRGKSYRTYIYTSRGYRELLSRVGFREVRLYGAMPNYVEPDTIVSEQSLNDYYARIFHEGKSPFKRILKGLMLFFGLSKLFVHSFIIVARK